MTVTIGAGELYRLERGDLSAEVWPHGGLRWLRHSSGDGELLVNLHPASGLEPGPANLWLRRWHAGRAALHPLLGPGSRSTVEQTGDAVLIVGSWQGLSYRATLTLSGQGSGWRWDLEISATDEQAGQQVDLVWTQDVGLAAPGAVRSNELYVSQYLDITPLTSERVGTVLAVRQNQTQGGRHPWLLLGSDHRAERYATDALQILGRSVRNGEPPVGLLADLPSKRLQHEHSVVALQTERVELGPGQVWRTGFFAHLVLDHPAPTSAVDLTYVEQVLAADSTSRVPDPPQGWSAHSGPASETLFAPARLWPSDQLAEPAVVACWGNETGELRSAERDGDGRLLSFFTADDRHVVLRAKEQQVLRPHGRLLRAGTGLLPDPSGLAATTWMTGSALSYLTVGHASNDRVLSTCRGYLGWQRAYGLRVFVQHDQHWVLLDQPSAYEMGLDRCRWTYRADGDEITVTTTMPTGGHRVEVTVEVTAGPPREFLLALGLADGDDGLEPGRVDHDVLDHAGGTRVTLHPSGTALELDGPVTVGDDGPLFADGHARGLRWLTIRTPERTGLTLGVGPDDHDGADPWPDLRAAVDLDGASGHAELVPLDASLPWLVSDALTHYLSPRGLEQYTGGAWGTRDVCQGPVELLLALGRHDELRRVLLMIMAAQDETGEWPQAFGFLPGDRLRMGPPHGDVIFWPMLAVGRYLLATGDGSLLEEEIPYADGGSGSVRDHLRRAIDLAAARVLPGTHLTAYGHGDWNDSLQPADPRQAAKMTSAWTVTLHHQALSTLADGLALVGRPGWADSLRGEAAVIAGEFAEHLMPASEDDGPEGVVAGYALFSGGRATDYLVHPRDTHTGLTYSVLPMIHAVISGLFTPDEARQHLTIIDEHLCGADGIRLFDAPPAYRGGATEHFQRAETATFVGREIGLMYTHAQLRYLEALAAVGRAEDLWHGLRQVINVAVTDVVPHARPRQANSYSSSSDAAVADRPEFAERYAAVVRGDIAVEGGWRVYSSGPGILVRIVRECLLGVRVRAYGLEIDPVLTSRFDGVAVSVPVGDQTLTVRFRVGADGGSVTGVGTAAAGELPCRRLPNPYRAGGVLITWPTLRRVAEGDEVRVTIG